MSFIGGFGFLLLASLSVAFLYTSIEKAREIKLIRDGLIPPFTGYQEAEIKKLKTDGYKTIALKRIRLGYEDPKKCSLKKAIEVYESL